MRMRKILTEMLVSRDCGIAVARRLPDVGSDVERSDGPVLRRDDDQRRPAIIERVDNQGGVSRCAA